MVVVDQSFYINLIAQMPENLKTMENFESKLKFQLITKITLKISHIVASMPFPGQSTQSGEQFH